jgi:hypothetical protein
MQQMLQQLLAMQEKADANRKAYREDIKSGQAKMIAAIKGKMDACVANIKDARKKATTCQEVTGANPETIEPNLGEKRPQWSSRRFLTKRTQFIH